MKPLYGSAMRKHGRGESIRPTKTKRWCLIHRGATTRRFICRFALPAALCAMAASTLAAEPKLRQTVDVPLRLPRNYEPAGLPAQPIDQELRVGVVLPAYDRAFNAFGLLNTGLSFAPEAPRVQEFWTPSARTTPIAAWTYGD